MQSWPDIREEVVYMANNHTQYLVLRNATVHKHVEGHQNPGQVGRREHQNTEEAESSIRVPSRPDVH